MKTIIFLLIFLVTSSANAANFSGRYTGVLYLIGQNQNFDYFPAPETIPINLVLSDDGKKGSARNRTTGKRLKLKHRGSNLAIVGPTFQSGFREDGVHCITQGNVYFQKILRRRVSTTAYVGIRCEDGAAVNLQYYSEWII